MRFEKAAKPRRTVLRGNGSEVHGTLIVKGALHQDYLEDRATGEWVTKTYSATFAIEDRRFAGIPSRGERVNIGPGRGFSGLLGGWGSLGGMDVAAERCGRNGTSDFSLGRAGRPT